MSAAIAASSREQRYAVAAETRLMLYRKMLEARYLEQRDVDALTSDVRRFAREHTPLFLGGSPYSAAR